MWGVGGGGVFGTCSLIITHLIALLLSLVTIIFVHITIICRLTHAPNSVIHLNFVSLYSTELSYRGDTKFYSDSCQPLSSQFTVIFQTAAFLY